jgi:hypothetical protein
VNWRVNPSADTLVASCAEAAKWQQNMIQNQRRFIAIVKVLGKNKYLFKLQKYKSLTLLPVFASFSACCANSPQNFPVSLHWIKAFIFR